MDDREALIAGIATDPDDDLRRLVFADWLDDHGEPERAEFVRLQVEAEAKRGTPEFAPLQARAGELFAAHAARWFAPFLTALDPTRDPTSGYVYSTSDHGMGIAEPDPNPPRSFFDADGSGQFVPRIDTRRGTLHYPSLNLSLQPEGCSLAEAFRAEPVTSVVAILTPGGHEWPRFTRPALRQVTDLFLHERTHRRQLTEFRQVYDDENLCGVRHLSLAVRQSNGSFGIATLPAETVREFEQSPLATRIAEFGGSVDDESLQVLCESSRLQLEQLDVHGVLTAGGIRRIAAAPFASRLKALSVMVLSLAPERPLAVLAEAATFSQLRELGVRDYKMTDRDIDIFVAAPFLPQLEKLVVSYSQDVTSEGWIALANGLNLSVLREFRIDERYEAELPAELKERLGDRLRMT